MTINWYAEAAIVGRWRDYHNPSAQASCDEARRFIRPADLFLYRIGCSGWLRPKSKP
jgi:hypothetical protein